MNREQIVQMARDAGILEPLGYENPLLKNWRDDVVRGLLRFSAIIRSDTKEEDAKICEKIDANYMGWANDCADAIRASK